VRRKALLFLWLASSLSTVAAERPKEIRALVDAAPVDQAFQMAGAAKYPFALSAAIGLGLSTDSDAGVRHAALMANVDALSLRCRAVSGTLSVNRKQALALFREIPTMRFPAHTCEDAMKESTGFFYETLGQVFAQAFTPQERAKSKHLDFAEEYLHGLTSPTELEPAMRMIAAQKLTPDEMGDDRRAGGEHSTTE